VNHFASPHRAASVCGNAKNTGGWGAHEGGGAILFLNTPHKQMTPEQIKKANWLSGIYTSVACGEELQILEEGEWRTVSYVSPNLQANPERWRTKPKPQKAWVVWGPGGPSAIIGEDIARQYARECGGIIQEITRPD